MGDSSLIGCGCYADNLSAAVSTTGWGEPMMKLVLSKWTADRVEQGTIPQEAAQRALYYLKSRLQGHGGIILLDCPGRVGIAHNTPRMAWASVVGDNDFVGNSVPAVTNYSPPQHFVLALLPVPVIQTERLWG